MAQNRKGGQIWHKIGKEDIIKWMITISLRNKAKYGVERSHCRSKKEKSKWSLVPRKITLTNVNKHIT